MLEKFICPPIGTNCYLLYCPETKQAAVIDTPFRSCSQVKVFVEKEGLQLSTIFLTHSHWDHIADAKQMQVHFKVPIYVHELDKKNLLSPGSDQLFSPIPIDAVQEKNIVTYQDEQKHTIGHLEIEIIYTPGHSPGGVCLYLEKQKILFTGDTLFAAGFGRLDLPTSKEEKMLTSLQRLSQLPKDVAIYPGHGPMAKLEQTILFQQNKY